MNVFFDSCGSEADPIKRKLLSKLSDIYGSIVYACGGKNAINNHKIAKAIKTADRVFIWNGSEYGCFWVKEICEQFNKPYCIFERGLFPQGDSNFMVDSSGICCRSKSLCPINYMFTKKMESSIEKYKEARKNQGIKWVPTKKNKNVFVFQLEFDSTVYHYSNFSSNEEMVDKIVTEKGLDPKSVVICPHPRNKKIKSKYKISKKKTIEECVDATMAYAISSTIIYELIFIGCPVYVLANGNHPAIRDWKNFDDMFISIYNNQFDVLTDNNEEILEKIERNL